MAQTKEASTLLNALATLAHDCRRPELFRPQVFAAFELSRRGGFNAVETKGAWAGEIGMIQMLPQDILENGFDGDADGKGRFTKFSCRRAFYRGAHA